MRRRKRAWQLANQLLLVMFSLLICQQSPSVHSMLLLSSNCLTSAPGCVCTWKGGKFVAECMGQSLNKVPKNDYDEFLAKNSGNTQMLTLNRDLQQLNLMSNNISELEANEFSRKKYLNLQRIILKNNKLAYIDSSAFDKLMGLVELDLSENLIVGDEQGQTNDDAEFIGRGSPNRLSFIQHLVLLRQLNLASNQLSQLDKFTFSRLTQLRQLSLSRNKISFIHRRAFEGLKLLEVLQLDGNKLSHLDGEILLDLPKLNAIQLAGSNPWRCDCHLREFVRNLMGPAGSGLALNGASSLAQLQISAGRLLDKPMCAPMHPRRLSDDESVGAAATAEQLEDSAPSAALSWTNMKLGQFECPPRPALKFMPTLVAQQESRPDATLLAQVMNMNEYLSRQEAGGQRKQQPKDEHEEDQEDQGGRVKRQDSGGDNHASDKNNNNHWLAELHLAPEEPMELTCAVELTDELDLELGQLEWWRLDGLGRRPTLLWRLNASDLADRGSQSMHVIDYVTRANGSTSMATDTDAEQAEIRPTLVRLEHLLQTGPSPQTMEANRTGSSASKAGLYLCRVTNKAGHLHVYHSVDTASPINEEQSRRRRRLRKVALEAAASQFGGQLAEAAGKLAHNWLPAAKLAVRRQPPPGRPLFVPIHLPAELSGSSASSAEVAASTRSPLEQPAAAAGQWRPSTTTRQVNRTRIPYGESTLSANNVGSDDEAPAAPKNATVTGGQPLNKPDLSLHSIALALIGRYTSNRLALIGGQAQSELLEPEEDEDDLISSQTGRQSPLAAHTMDARGWPLWESLRSTWRQARRRYLDKWSAAESNLLLLSFGLAVGLLLGCTLTALVIVRLRKATGRPGRRRVGDSSCDAKQLDHEEEEEADQSGSQSPPGGPESTLGELGACLVQAEADKAANSGGSSAGGSTSNGSQCKLIKCSPATGRQNQPIPARQQAAVGQQQAAGYELFLQDQSYQSDLEADISGALEDSLASYALAGRQPVDLGSCYEQLGAASCRDPLDLQESNGTRTRQLIVLQAPDYPQQELGELLLSPYYAIQQQEQQDDSFRLIAAQDQLMEACQQVGLAPANARHAHPMQNANLHLDKSGRLCSISGQDLRPLLHPYADNLNSLASPAASTSSSQLTAGAQRQRVEQVGDRPQQLSSFKGGQSSRNLVYLDEALELLQSSVDACQLLEQSDSAHRERQQRSSIATNKRSNL